ncbi:hypothetical protein WJX74_002757 [Apatococcus lobatus]|uniref:WD repeat domain phosphoinositide-interacting protein 3 n=1 Tax=Apatococcus lobatus TaxID=904363 RepID=A0AAW1SDA0_9CHLO
MGDNSSSNELLGVTFNQDFGCFACGTSTGFRVYNCEPFGETFRRESNEGGIAIVEMLFRCNILAIVGGGSSPRYNPNKVMIWDDHQGRCIGELTFKSQVRNVKLRRDRIVVALEHKVLVYNFADLKLVHPIDTMTNPNGLIALSASADQTVLACPGLTSGQVRIELYDVQRTKWVHNAHSSPLACMALSLNGKLLATASERGTLVRIHATQDGTRLQELRRGADPARIYSLAFSKGNQPDWLAVSSDKGTVHVFSLQPRSPATDLSSLAARQDNDNTAKNPVSPISFVSSWLPVPYFASERSFAQFKLPEATRSIVGFGPQQTTLLVVSTTGTFYSATFDADKGGNCHQQNLSSFLQKKQVF